MNAAHKRPPSLWRHLWAWALVTTTTVWLTLAGVAFYTGHHEAEEIAEGQLQSIARHWLALSPAQWPLPAPGDTEAAPPRDPQAMVPKRSTYTTEWAVLLWQGDTLRLDTHGLATHLPTDLAPGLRTTTLRGEPGTWRLWVQDSADSDAVRRVAVLVPVHAHTALGRDIAEHIVRPALVLLPLVALLLAWALRRGLGPVRRLAGQVARLDLNSGERLPDEHRFAEVEGTVRAINTLVRTLQAQLQRERGFASDVAHELRTPLTALLWQARRALAADPTDSQPSERREALQAVESEARRAAHILQQLLDMARAQGLNAEAQVPVHLSDLAAKVVADHAPAAFQGGRELALQDDAPDAVVTGHPLMLELALRNLVDNALAHTPVGTQVLVRVWREAGDGGPTQGLDVLDDGGGPGPAQPDASGQRQHLGIGLTLVRRIAQAHGARFGPAPTPAPFNHGHRLSWPASATSARV